MERLCLSLLSRQPWVHGRHLQTTLPDLDSRPLWGDPGAGGSWVPTAEARLSAHRRCLPGRADRGGGRSHRQVGRLGVSLALPRGLPGRKQGLPVSSAGRRVLGCRYELLRVLGFPIRGEVLNVLARLCN